MDSGRALRHARIGAGLTQTELARQMGTSQATLSAYERGRKQPSVATLGRLLEACGERLQVGDAPAPVRRPRAAELDRAGEVLEEVIALAELLPTRHEAELRFPRLPVPVPTG